ncbi:MAG: hypothetical protein QG635_542, partial [Bacteroidota bacterium]|nr:hypothetical protein [Bacteroidota bacterium]
MEIFSIIILLIYLYTFALYPVLLCLLSKIINKPVAASLDYLPELSLIMAAYNEESTIKDAIDSIFQSDYPAGKIKVFVGSDGSTDHTNEILKSLKAKYPDLNYFEFERTGKNMLLNKIAKHIDSEIICFMDADCRVKS